jgi:hypothetical protein
VAGKEVAVIAALVAEELEFLDILLVRTWANEL